MRQFLKNSFWSLIVLSLIATTGQSAPADDNVPGVVSITATQSLIDWPAGTSRLIFGTSNKINQDNIPQWRVLGNQVVVDSVEIYGVTRLADSSTMAKVIVGDALASALAEIGAASIGRTCPGAIPNDTLVFNKLLRKQVKVPDVSIYYYAVFDESVAVDLALGVLQEVSGIGQVNAQREVYPLECTDWVPNDPALDDQWQLSEGSGGQGGSSVRCAWSLLWDGYRGNTLIGFIDWGIPLPGSGESNPEVIDKTHPLSETYTSAHGVKVAAIAAAETDNDFLIAGVAPDADMIVLNVDISPMGSTGKRGWSLGMEDCPRVINMSLGSSGPSPDEPNPVLDSIAARLVLEKNTTLIAAAGNQGGMGDVWQHPVQV